MGAFKSNEELFHAVEDLAASLERSGHRREAEALMDGFRCLNGLTDGWGLFLDAIKEVEKGSAAALDDAQRESLGRIHDAVHQCVYRRRRAWWKFW